MASAETVDPSPAPRLRFDLALQRSRFFVHLTAFGLAILGKLTGVLHVAWRPGLALGVFAVGSALVCQALYRRRVRLDLRPFWMGADIFICTCGVAMTGGLESPWYLWYLSNTGAAAFVAGLQGAALVAGLNSIAYLGTLAAMHQLDDAQSVWLALVRLAFLYGAAFFFLRGVARLKDSQRLLKQAREDERLKVEELIQLTQDLDQGTRALAEANLQIREADRVKSQFLANMSHELRTPLNSIIGFSEVLLERLGEEVPERYRKFLANIHASGQHLLGIINDILDLSKVEAGKMDLHPEDLDVPAMIDGVLTVMHGLAARRGITLQVEVAGGLSLNADPAKFKQVLYNLVSNAVKFSAENAIVIVRVRAGAAGDPLAEPSVVVSVVDTGIGIAAADHELIFQEFRQADGTASRQFGGTGLGLALVRKFVEFQGGKVWVESALGAGSTFTFALPQKPRAGSADALVDMVDTAPRLPGASRVLVVEDELAHYHTLAKSLSAAGYFPIRARLGEEALQMARLIRPTAVTLDIVLPDMSGWDVLRELKRDVATRHIPVVIISMMESRELGLTLGASDYFLKPLDRESFVARLTEIAPRTGTDAAHILLVDDDPDVHELLGEELGRLGYMVEHALCGQDGLDRARNRRPDAVVLDLMMPDLSGFEVADALRAHEPTAHVPIVVLTAKDLSHEDRLRLQGKIAALVQKGQAIPPRLVAAIRELEGQRREANSAR